jgi:hypothetical protein
MFDPFTVGLVGVIWYGATVLAFYLELPPELPLTPPKTRNA